MPILLNRGPWLSVLLIVLVGCSPSPILAQVDTYDSGGPLMAEQAAYDVSFYEMTLAVHPADSTISGKVRTIASVHDPLPFFVLDLDQILAVGAIYGGTDPEATLSFERKGGKIWIKMPFTRQPGETVDVTVEYSGKPRIAPNPPWSGGFTWTTTESGAPWIATTCQQEGADIWWPVKEHVSDEPDSMKLHITVPDPLIVATNGRMRDVTNHSNGTSTYHWDISNPINTYNVALNIAPYRVIEDTFDSVAGDSFPVQFFVLPEDYENGQNLFPEILNQLRYFESVLGPYPFRSDKYGAVQTPHLGMEHQTIIAYGANFSNRSMTRGSDWGFDALLQHESSHEWWGNLVTNVGWNDMWLHEGFGSYMQPLYEEYLYGPERYHDYMNSQRKGITNRLAVAPRKNLSSKEIYNGDIYSKGSWVLHSMRYLLGDDVFFKVLRRMAYPDPGKEKVTDGSQTRFAVTDDFLDLAQEISGEELSWFFEVYLRQPELPAVHVSRDGPTVSLTWSTPENLPFPMPLDVSVDGEIRRIDMSDGSATFQASENARVTVDPDNRVLRAGN